MRITDFHATYYAYLLTRHSAENNAQTLAAILQDSNYFEEEPANPAKWSKDIKIGMERILHELDKAIDEVNIQLRGRQLTLQRRLELQEKLAQKVENKLIIALRWRIVQMINKRFENITIEDIEGLVANKTNENITLEYKLKLSLGASGRIDDTVKAELVKDISAFANADGGLIIYGVEENEHLPVAVKGVEINDEDALRRRIIEIVSNNTDPSFANIKMRTIPFDSGKVIFLVKIEKNLLTLPRRNKFDNSFWVRTDNKASCMDTATIIGYANTRQQAKGIFQKVGDYKTNRLNEIITNANKRIIANQPYIIMHFIPEDFDSFHCDINAIKANTIDRRTDVICPSHGANFDIEMDGFLMFYAPNDRLSPVECIEYMKFYKNGIVEWASNWLIVKPHIDWKGMVESIFALTKKLLIYYEAIGNTLPLHIGITLTNIQGCGVAINNYRNSKPLELSIFNSADICLQKPSDFNPFTYKRFLDDLYNALGLSGCPIYKDEQTLDYELLDYLRITL